MKLKPESKSVSKPKLKQPTMTALTYKHLSAHLDKQAFVNGHVPFKTARQFSSIGTATSEQLSPQDQRHEYFSELERKFGLVLGFMTNVSNVRTQVPILDVQATLDIAEQLNIMHPRYEPRTNVSDENSGYQAAIMSTDYLFDYADSSTGEIVTVAVSIKYSSEVSMLHGEDRVIQRTHDKFEIERCYWENEHGNKFLVITSGYWMFEENLVDNLSIARVHRKLNIPPVLETSLIVYFRETLSAKQKMRLRLVDVIHSIALKTNLPTDHLYSVFWNFVWTKKINVDLFKPLSSGEYVFNGEDFAWAW